jgi:hypothetical protein
METAHTPAPARYDNATFHRCGKFGLMRPPTPLDPLVLLRADRSAAIQGVNPNALSSPLGKNIL